MRFTKHSRERDAEAGKLPISDRQATQYLLNGFLTGDPAPDVSLADDWNFTCERTADETVTVVAGVVVPSRSASGRSSLRSKTGWPRSPRKRAEAVRPSRGSPSKRVLAASGRARRSRSRKSSDSWQIPAIHYSISSHVVESWRDVGVLKGPPTSLHNPFQPNRSTSYSPSAPDVTSVPRSRRSARRRGPGPSTGAAWSGHGRDCRSRAFGRRPAR